MSANAREVFRILKITGLATLAVGVLAVLFGFGFNAVTAGGDGGANIGAGLIVILGVVVVGIGVVLALVGIGGQLLSRNR